MRTRFASRALGTLPLLLLLGPSCSLVYDLSPDQCGTNGDCAHFGPGLQCQNGVCICDGNEQCSGIVTTGGTGNGGNGGVGGATGGTLGAFGGDAGMLESGGVGGTSAASGIGGTSGKAGGSAGGKGGAGGSTGGVGGSSGGKGGTTGGTSGDAGMGGVPDVTCDSHNDCYLQNPQDYSFNPKACVEHHCVPLMSDDCPIVLPIFDNNKWNLLRSSDAIILGGFAYIPNGSLYSPNTYNYDLALTELSNKTQGVYAGSSTKHQIVMVVCNPNQATQADLLVPAKHLIQDLKVPGIVAQLVTQDQEYLFNALGTKETNDVFFMMTRYSDQELVSLPDDGLVWSMLSGPNAIAVSAQPLLDNIETHLRNLGTVGSAEDMRVMLVRAPDEPFLADLGSYVIDNVTFNSSHALAKDQVASGAFKFEDTESYYLDSGFDQGPLVADILAFKPHVIIAANANEMPRTIMPLLEGSWDDAVPGQDRPFYLLSPLNYNETEMPTLVGLDTSISNSKTPLYQRMLGLTWPAALDQTNYDAYQLRFKAAYKGLDAPGYENYYDAAYNMIYAVAASTQPLTGSAIATAMPRIISGSDNVVNVGANSQMTTAINSFKTDPYYQIEVDGAMGPPNWDAFGGRSDPGSIFCVNSSGAFAPDVQRYNTGTMLLEPATIDDTTCFNFPAP